MKTEYINPKMIDHVLYALTPQNRLICRVCLSTGLRVGDVLNLKTAALREYMTITEMKTGKKRRIRFSKSLLNDLKEQAGSVYVFEHRTDPQRHKTRQAVYADLKRAAKAFRIRENLSIHSLRKIYAAELYKKTGDLDKVRRALNHDNELVTLVYALSDILQKRK
jgi:integrase